MTETITDILTRLDKIFAQFPEQASFSLIMQDGKIKRHLTAEGSSHAKLSLMAQIPKVETWMSNLPVVSACNGNWSIAGGKTRGFNSSKFTREYRCMIMNLSVTRPASPRIKTAAEMISGAYDRLVEVERNAASQHLPVHQWEITSKQRETRRLHARSAREAAWCYAALYVRNRKEVRAWREAIDDISKVVRIYSQEDWLTPCPCPHS